MTVSLSQSKSLPSAELFDQIVRISSKISYLPSGLQELDLTLELEQAFDNNVNVWFQIAKSLGQEKSAGLAHMPACVANASDFGQMLAWTEVVAKLALEEIHTHVLVDDPWLYRHLISSIEFRHIAKQPPIWTKLLPLVLRGYIARAKCTLNLFFNFLKFRDQQNLIMHNGPVLLVYGHTQSSPDGTDAYFGSLLKLNNDLSRILHVDCRGEKAEYLCRSANTNSLHAWGSLKDLLSLPFVKWRPRAEHVSGPFKWLIQRAAVLEGSTAQAAMIEWQYCCQSRWLAVAKPKSVAWPWENHSWEREFVCEARRNDVRTIGYQHSVIGRQMLNYSPNSNPDGLDNVPDRILCTGQIMADQLESWNVPTSRMKIGGAFRFKIVPSDNWNPDGPVYIALPFDFQTSAEMIQAARRIVGDGFNFRVKPHPMTPFQFSDEPGIAMTQNQFYEEKRVSAVVYAASAVGLESLLSGIPTIRFQPTNRISLNILPVGLDIPSTNINQLKEQLRKILQPANISREKIFAPIDWDLWNKELKLEAHNESA